MTIVIGSSKEQSLVSASAKRGDFPILEDIENALKTLPEDFSQLYKVPTDADPLLWQYEHLRHFVIELNHLVVVLEPICTKDTCPIMKATDEWIYLCAAHKSPQECCAFEYVVHTLDSITCLLTNTKIFPTRQSPIPSHSIQYFQSMSRRLYRIFSHMYFHHRAAFESLQIESKLYPRFVYFCQHFRLIPSTLVIIPPKKPQALK